MVWVVGVIMRGSGLVGMSKRRGFYELGIEVCDLRCLGVAGTKKALLFVSRIRGFRRGRIE